MIWIICKKTCFWIFLFEIDEPILSKDSLPHLTWTLKEYHAWWSWGPVEFSICMHNIQFHFCEVDLDFERMEEWRMETLWHFPFAYATPPRFMPLPVQCGKFQLQYEDTGNFEIDFREEFSQNIKTLNNCEKVDNTFTFRKLSLTQILDFFISGVAR